MEQHLATHLLEIIPSWGRLECTGHKTMQGDDLNIQTYSINLFVHLKFQIFKKKIFRLLGPGQDYSKLLGSMGGQGLYHPFMQVSLKSLHLALNIFLNKILHF